MPKIKKKWKKNSKSRTKIFTSFCFQFFYQSVWHIIKQLLFAGMLQSVCTLEHNKFFFFFSIVAVCSSGLLVDAFVFSFIHLFQPPKRQREREREIKKTSNNKKTGKTIWLMRFAAAHYCYYIFSHEEFSVYVIGFDAEHRNQSEKHQDKRRHIANYDNCNYLLRIDCSQLFRLLVYCVCVCVNMNFPFSMCLWSIWTSVCDWMQ